MRTDDLMAQAENINVQKQRLANEAGGHGIREYNALKRLRSHRRYCSDSPEELRDIDRLLRRFRACRVRLS